MTLPVYGNPISLTQIQTEFGGSNPIGISEYYAGGGLVAPGTVGYPTGAGSVAIPSSGTISLANFFGASNITPASGSAVRSTVGSGLLLSIPNTEPVWIAFKIMAAGGSGGGADDVSYYGGGGGAGTWAQGIVQLPATGGNKDIYVGLGGPGSGGQSKGDSSINETGGSGFGFSNTWPSTATGTGGLGINDVGDNQSGGAGAGGGATYIYYNAVPIAQVGGGGGGGGGSNGVGAQSSVINANGSNRGVVTSIPTGISDMVGQPGVAIGGPGNDGGAGGAGGGGYGLAGTQGHDNTTSSTGGSAGYSVQNTALTWNSFTATPTTRQGTQGIGAAPSGFSQPISGVVFGKGGVGAAGGTNMAEGGVQGAISIYWTNSPTAPSIASVPTFVDPPVTITMPGTQDLYLHWQYISFNSLGEITYYDPSIGFDQAWTDWVSGAPLNGIGEFYELYFTYGPPTGNYGPPFYVSYPTGTLYTNLTPSAWNNLTPKDGYQYYFGTNNDGYLDFTVTLRRKATGTTYGPYTWSNVGSEP